MTRVPQYDGQPFFPPVAWAAWQSGRYYFAPNHTATAVASTLGVGTLRAGHFVIPNPVTLVRIGAEITNNGDVGSKLRLGLYADDGTGHPGTLIVDAGTIAGDSITVQEITIAQPLQAGSYWSCAVVQVVTVAQPQVRINSQVGFTPQDCGTTIPSAGRVAASYTRTGIVGALPATFGSPGIDPTGPPRIVVKVG